MLFVVKLMKPNICKTYTNDLVKSIIKVKVFRVKLDHEKFVRKTYKWMDFWRA